MDNKLINRPVLLGFTIMVEGILLLIASAWIYFAHLPLATKLHYNSLAFGLGILLGLATSIICFVIYILGKHIPFLENLRKFSQEYFAPIAACVQLPDILFISAMSGFAEEILFRGVMQQQFGIVLASVLFGVFHDPTFKHIQYVITACILGLALGILYQVTNNLWAPVLAHAVHNLISLLFLKYWVKKESKQAS